MAAVKSLELSEHSRMVIAYETGNPTDIAIQFYDMTIHAPLDTEQLKQVISVLLDALNANNEAQS